MLEVIGAAPGSHKDTDWFEVWRLNPEYKQARAEIDGLISERLNHTRDTNVQRDDADLCKAFAARFAQQMREVTYRILEQYITRCSSSGLQEWRRERSRRQG